MAVRSNGPDTDFGFVCTLTLEIWPRVKIMTPLGHGQQLCKILSRSNLAVVSYGPDTDFCMCAQCVTLTLDQGNYTLFGHGQQLCEISTSNMAVRSYGPDTDFGYVCTLTLEI